jgi:DNA-binding NtrC family response regulator
LLGRIASSGFDPDLFYRLNTIHLVLSPGLLITT